MSDSTRYWVVGSDLPTYLPTYLAWLTDSYEYFQNSGFTLRNVSVSFRLSSPINSVLFFFKETSVNCVILKYFCKTYSMCRKNPNHAKLEIKHYLSTYEAVPGGKKGQKRPKRIYKEKKRKARTCWPTCQKSMPSRLLTLLHNHIPHVGVLPVDGIDCRLHEEDFGDEPRVHLAQTGA